MKLSFWTLGTPDWTNDAVVDAAKRFGFQGVDLRCAPGRNISLMSPDDEIERLKDLFAGSGIDIASLLAYNERGNADGVDWPAVTADLIAHVELANRVGTTSMRVNGGAPARGGSWDPYLEGLARALSDALGQTEGVTMNMQNHPGSLNAAQVVQLAEMVGSERFGAGFSPDHCIDMAEDPLAAVKAVAPWVRHLHLADRERPADGRLKACLPGTGFVPNREVLGVLAGRGYDGWVSFKWEKPTYPDLPEAEVALPHFISFMSNRPRQV